MIKAIVASLAVSSVLGFVPVQNARSTQISMMASERSKSLPFLIKPPKV